MLCPGLRKFTLAVHLGCSVGWIGAVVAYLSLAVVTATSEPFSVRAAWIGMDVVGWLVLVPLATGALLTGIVLAVGTPWGLFNHYWVVFSLVLTALCTAILVLHMPAVTHTASIARAAPSGIELGTDLLHPLVGLVLLLVILALNVYKPRGLTPLGWRRQERMRGTAALAFSERDNQPLP